MGRAGVDLYPMQLETPLEKVEGFHKYVGGFAANVATGLARLGVRVAIVSAVGDDGHGRFVRRFLESEGVDCRRLRSTPAAHRARVLRGLAARPLPDHLLPHPDVPGLGADAGRDRPGRDRSGAARLRQRHRPRPRASRLATMAVVEARADGPGTTMLDLDWRAMLWDDPADYAAAVGVVRADGRLVLGSDEEIAAAVGATSRQRILALGAAAVAQKHGPDGATVHSRDGPSERISRIRSRSSTASAPATRSRRPSAGGCCAATPPPRRPRWQPGRRPRRRPARVLAGDANEGDLE